MKSIRDVEVKDKTVFMRVDFNVPFKESKIADNNRIRAAIPTIKYLQEEGAKIILGTHMGRPTKYEPNFSTVTVARELSNLLVQEVLVTDNVIDPSVKAQVATLKPGEILVLGNLRFDPGEEKNSATFASHLAEYADLYVNDAFGVSHRADASVDKITEFLPSYAGLLLESEITSLGLLLQEPAHPFVVVIGGVKIKDKAGVIEHLAGKVDRFLIGGGVANTFLKARGDNIGQSLYDEDMVPACKKMLQDLNNKILLPDDFVKEDEASETNFRILDIGPKTRERYTAEIRSAKSVFWNGNLGYTEDAKYIAGTRAVADAMIASESTKVVAGGDTVYFIDQNNLRTGFSFISTGGGAALDFLAGMKLPGIEALNKTVPNE